MCGRGVRGWLPYERRLCRRPELSERKMQKPLRRGRRVAVRNEFRVSRRRPQARVRVSGRVPGRAERRVRQIFVRRGRRLRAEQKMRRRPCVPEPVFGARGVRGERAVQGRQQNGPLYVPVRILRQR